MTKAEQQTFLEQNLRGLQTPNESLWWPPAVGWWIIAVLLVLLIGTLVYKLLRNRSSSKRQLPTIASELENCFVQWQADQDTVNYIHSVSALLKQSAIRYADRKTVARLHGHKWIEWMERETDTTFSKGTRTLLSHGAYKKSPPLPDLQSHAEIAQWNRRYTEISLLNLRTKRKSIKRIETGIPHNA